MFNRLTPEQVKIKNEVYEVSRQILWYLAQDERLAGIVQADPLLIADADSSKKIGLSILLEDQNTASIYAETLSKTFSQVAVLQVHDSGVRWNGIMNEVMAHNGHGPLSPVEAERDTVRSITIHSIGLDGDGDVLLGCLKKIEENLSKPIPTAAVEHTPASP